MDIDNLLAFCGLSCNSCPIYLASRESDRQKQAAMRKAIAGFIGQHYGLDVKPEDINDCDGCRTPSGRLYAGCSHCEIRRCAQQRACVTCAHCLDYPCNKLLTFFISEPQARSRLDAIRKTLIQANGITTDSQ